LVFLSSVVERGSVVETVSVCVVERFVECVERESIAGRECFVDFLGVEESALKTACCREGVGCVARKGVVEKRCFCISGEFCTDGVCRGERVCGVESGVERGLK